MALALLPVLLVATGGVLRQAALAEPGIYAEITFEHTETDPGEGKHGKKQGKKPKKEVDKESKKYKLAKPKIKWFDTGETAYYQMIGIPGEFVSAVNDGVAEFDGFITTRSFVHDNALAQSQINPCTGEPNTISWLTADGPGGVLAAAAACYNTKTKEIVGFRMAFDSEDDWATDGDPLMIDLANVATHEMGHVAGLDHVNGPKEVCLTMYPYSSRGETQKRTLGWGDKLGMDKLYKTGDKGKGPGCGL